MVTMMSLLAGIGLLATVLNLSLLPKWRYVVPMCLLVGVGLYFAHPLTTEINLNRLYEALTAYELMATLSAYLVFEGLCIVLACHYLASEEKDGGSESQGLWPGQVVTAWLRERAHAVLGYFAYLPSVILLIALVVWQSWLFHNISGTSFQLIALTQAAVVAVTLVAACWIVRVALPLWHLRVELRILLAMFQVGLAMFLPVIASGTRAIGNPYEIDVRVTLAVLAVMIGLALTGLTIQRIGLNLKRKRA